VYAKPHSYNFKKIDEADAMVSAGESTRLFEFAEMDRCRVWENDGCRDMVHYLTARYGIGAFRAKRWLDASYAIKKLPSLRRALAEGVLGLDKVVELCRFATADTEEDLINWARRVVYGTVRGRADEECAPPIEEVREIDRERKVEWWWSDGGTRFGLMADLPAAEGALVVAAIDQVAAKVPSLPSDLESGLFGDVDPSETVGARRADAFLKLCAGWRGTTGDKMATIHLNVDLQRVLDRDGNSRIDGGGVVHPDVLDMLLCDSNIQTVLQEGPEIIGIGNTQHDPSDRVRRQVIRRDVCCTFPGCGQRMFTQVHHIIPWPLGPSILDNLTLVCFFHHRLIHVQGWRVALMNGVATWFRPDGRSFEGPAPPSRKRISA
jgi:hypothetical protein